MPLSLIVYDDAANKKGSEAFAQGDGPPRGRELEIADILRFIKTSGVANTVWLTADVHYAAAHYYNPDKAQFQEFDPFWEFVSGPLHAGTFGPNELDNTFGPEVRFIKAPGPDKQNLPPSDGMQFFGHVKIDGQSGQMTVTLRDRADMALWSTTLDPKLAGGVWGTRQSSAPIRKIARPGQAANAGGVTDRSCDPPDPPDDRASLLETSGVLRADISGRLSASVEQGLGSLGRRAKAAGKPDIGAVTGDEDKRNLQRIQPLGNRKAFFADQPDIEQRKIRGAVGNQSSALRHICRGAHRLHPETKNRVLEVERDDRIILDNQHVVGQASVGRGGFHDLAGQEVGCGRVEPGRPAPTPQQRLGRFPI